MRFIERSLDKINSWAWGKDNGSMPNTVENIEYLWSPKGIISKLEIVSKESDEAVAIEGLYVRTTTQNASMFLSRRNMLGIAEYIESGTALLG